MWAPGVRAKGAVIREATEPDPRVAAVLDFPHHEGAHDRGRARAPRHVVCPRGFEHTGRHDHSDNWRAPGAAPLTRRTAVQFSAEDEGIADAVKHASVVDLANGVRLRVASVADLIVLKLAAAVEPARRPSKREHDLADVLALLEEHPELASPEMAARVKDVRRQLMA